MSVHTNDFKQKSFFYGSIDKLKMSPQLKVNQKFQKSWIPSMFQVFDGFHAKYG